MIEYITRTGIFGVLWCILTLIFPFILYKFIKRNPQKAILTILQVIIFFAVLNQFASKLLGDSRFDTSLILLKDMWFLAYHVAFIGSFMMVDKELMNNLFNKKKRK